MDYLKLRTYETVHEKFKKAKKTEQLLTKRGVHEISVRHMMDIEGNILEETVYFHKWCSEHSCYITEMFRLFY